MFWYHKVKEKTYLGWMKGHKMSQTGTERQIEELQQESEVQSTDELVSPAWLLAGNEMGYSPEIQEALHSKGYC